MKRILIVGASVIVGVAISMLGGCATPPSAGQVSQIQVACQQDALIRPVVTGLLPLATPQESLAITEAEKGIDVVCANPTASPDANAQAMLNGAIAQVTSMEATLLAREVAAKAIAK